MTQKTEQRKYSQNIVSVKYLLLFALALRLLIFTPVVAQILPVHHYMMRDGLPSNSIRAVFKDSRGLLWIGTDNGLCTFDGKKFKIYSSQEGFFASNVWSITEDNKGILWFGSRGNGLFRYDGRKFMCYNTKNGLISDWIRVVYYSRQFNCLMVGTEKGLSVMKDNKFVIFHNSKVNPADIHVITGFSDRKDYIFITGYGQVISKYYPSAGQILRVEGNEVLYPSCSCTAPIVFKGDTIWGISRSGIAIRGRNSHSIQLINGIGQVFNMDNDDKNYVWFAAWSFGMAEPGGLFRYDGTKVENVGRSLGINDRETWTVFYDKSQELLWVGTLNKGLFLVKPDQFEIIEPESLGLKDLKVNDLFCDRAGDLWISCPDRIIKKAQNGEVTSYAASMNAAYRKFVQKKFPRGIPVKSEYTADLDSENQDNGNFQEDSKGDIWINNKLGTFGIHPGSGTVEFSETYIHMDFRFGEGDTAYFGGWLGYAVVPDIRNFAKTALFQKSLKGPAPRGNINCLARRGNEIWLGSENDGVFKQTGLDVVNYKLGPNGVHQSISCIAFDNRNHIIVGTKSGNVCLCEIKADSLVVKQCFTSYDGLIGNSISYIIYDKSRYLWVGTNTGLNRIDLSLMLLSDKLNVINFDAEEGYTTFSARNAVIDKAGNLWVGGEEGLLKFKPLELRTKSSQPPSVVLTEVEINNIPFHDFGQDVNVGWGDLPEEYLILDPLDNKVAMYFDNYNYLNPSKDKFRYKLLGLDKDWSPWGSQRRAVYQNLTPGKYTFLVECKNSVSSTTQQPLKFLFRIRPPWWQRWYWISVFVTLVLGSTWFLVQLRIKQVKKQAQQKTEMQIMVSELELGALRAQMNPHFIFNSINSIQRYILENNVDLALTYLSDFSKVVRVSLENVNKKLITLEDALDFLKSFLNLEQMRFPGKFSSKFVLPDDLDTRLILIPPMIIQPYVENAIRHGFRPMNSGGFITVSFKLEGEHSLNIFIEDNGIGRAAAGEHLLTQGIKHQNRAHSTEITENRIRLMNRPGEKIRYEVIIFDLQNLQGKACGTRVEVTLPLIEAG
ncbi:MAG: two-component regulator propeller domain-containing protein [Bacteroidota bacterium]